MTKLRMSKRRIINWLQGLIGLTFLMVFLTSTPASSQPNQPNQPNQPVTCVPNAPGQIVLSEPITIATRDFDILQGRFYWAAPEAGGQFPAGSLAAMMMTHGFPGTSESLQNRAEALARRCFLTLIWTHRGQGANVPETPLFDFWSDFYEVDDLTRLTDTLFEGPPSVSVELVDPTKMGILGFSQGGINAWLAVAHLSLRGSFKMAIPYDGFPVSTERLLPNQCANANLAQFFHPANVRIPCPEPGCDPNEAGVSWYATTYNTFKSYYVDNHPPLMSQLDAFIEAREIDDNLAQSGAAFPHIFPIISWYDTQLFADEVLTAFDMVTPPLDPGVPAYYPRKHILLTTGGHSNPVWHAANEESYRDTQRLDWAHTYLYRFGTPIDQALVDYVDDAFVGGLPQFTRKTTESWPITASDTISLYLRVGGVASRLPPVEEVGADTVAQTLTDPTYTMSQAVAETPAFNSAPSVINETPQMYRTAPLCQAVTLVTPPRVELHATSSGAPASPHYQLHLRLHEEPSGGSPLFVTQANACAWNAGTPAPAIFRGRPFSGEVRVHTFAADSRITLEFNPIDLEVYFASNNKMSMTPHLGNFELLLHREGGPGLPLSRDTNVRVGLVRSQPAYSGIFVGEANCPPGGGAPQGMAAAPAAEAEPLAITATPYDNFTNPGDWRAWVPEVLISCTGGEGVVTCPASPQFILTEGISQTISYTATDTSGTVVTATLTGITVDRTPPVVTVAVPELPAACSGMPLEIDYSVSDALSGVESSSATFNGQAASLGQTVLLVAGVNALNVETRDVAGNVVNQETVIQCDS